MKPGSVKLGILIGRCRTTPSMKSGGGVLLVSALQLIVGLVILFIYEGYKGHYLSHSGSSPPRVRCRRKTATRPLRFMSAVGD